MSLCDDCGGACCRFFMVMPKKGMQPSKLDWARYHDIVESENHIGIPNKCQHLNEEGRCDIYEHRPMFCAQAKINDVVCRASRELWKSCQGETK